MNPAAPKAPTADELAEAAEQEGPVEAPPLFDINTVNPKRATIKIDGKTYEIQRLGDYGIEDQHIIQQDSVEFDQLWTTKSEDLEEADKARLPLLLDRLAAKAIKVPKSVRDKLNDEQKKQIVQVFTSASAQSLQRILAQALLEMRDQQAEARNGSTTES